VQRKALERQRDQLKVYEKATKWSKRQTALKELSAQWAEALKKNNKAGLADTIRQAQDLMSKKSATGTLSEASFENSIETRLEKARHKEAQHLARCEEIESNDPYQFTPEVNCHTTAALIARFLGARKKAGSWGVYTMSAMKAVSTLLGWLVANQDAKQGVMYILRYAHHTEPSLGHSWVVIQEADSCFQFQANAGDHQLADWVGRDASRLLPTAIPAWERFGQGKPLKCSEYGQAIEACIREGTRGESKNCLLLVTGIKNVPCIHFGFEVYDYSRERMSALQEADALRTWRERDSEKMFDEFGKWIRSQKPEPMGNENSADAFGL
jgi:hypothetical protein